MINTVKERFLKKINSNNINIHSVEKKAGLKTGSLRNIIIGRSVNPGIFTVLAACKALGCSLSEILGEEPNHNINNRKNIPWNKKLYEKAIEEVSNSFRKRNMPTTLEKIQNYATEIYLYSLNNNNEKFDKNFAQWLLKKDSL